MRVFALSDLHVDYQSNMLWLQQLSSTDYTEDTLILAGDVNHNFDKIEQAFSLLCAKFAHIFFVPGNHDLWIRGAGFSDSIEKFWRVLALCESFKVKTGPFKIVDNRVDNGVWVVPLFSWYLKPEEGPGSLFLPKKGEEPTLKIWSDNYFIKWPPLREKITIADYFLQMNEKHLGQKYDAPVISFSHFLPRTDLILNTTEEGPNPEDPEPSFNFSRVAGCVGLEKQIRKLGSMIHVYGHQHRNRYRHIDGVLYVSHCLGYPHERETGGLEEFSGPKLIWNSL